MPQRASELSRAWLALVGLGILAGTRWPPIAVPAVWLLVNYWPGRLAAELLGIDRDWDRLGRQVLFVCLSLAVAPLFLHALWTYTHDELALLLSLMGVLFVGQAWVALRRARRRPAPAPTEAPLRFSDGSGTQIAFLALAAFLAACCLLTQWPTVIDGVALPVALHDYIKHHAVMLSLELRPLPLRNVFYADGFDTPTYYYHLYYLAPATVRVVCPGVPISLAYGLQQATVATGLIGVAWLMIKRLTRADAPALWAALFMSVVGGLDVVMLLVRGSRSITLDAWADPLVRIHNLLTQIIWTPQNTQSLLIALVGAFLLSRIGWRRAWFVLGPLLMTNLIGAGVWVAMGVAVGLLLWTPLTILNAPDTWRGMIRRFGGAAAVGLLMAVFAGPLLLGYAEMARRTGRGLTAIWPELPADAWPVLFAPGPLANLVDLPRLMLLEFGALLALPLLLPRRVWRIVAADAGWRLLLICAGVALFGFVTFRSTFSYNDFGHKIMLLAQVCGALLASLVFWRGPAPSAGRLNTWAPIGPARWVAVGVIFLTVALGSAVGVFQTPLAAIRRWTPPDSQFAWLIPERAGVARAEAGLTEFVREDTPRDAVIQPDCGPERVYLPQLTNRRLGIAILDPDTEVFYPRDAAARAATLAEVQAALSQWGNAARAAETLRAHGVTHVYVGVIERERWTPAALEKFSDAAHFEQVYTDSVGAIFRLRPASAD